MVAELKQLYGKSIFLSVDVKKDYFNHTLTSVYISPQDPVENLEERQEEIAWYLSKIFYLSPDKVADISSTIAQLDTELSLEPVDMDGEEENHLHEKYPRFDVKSFLATALNVTTSELPEHIYIYDEGTFSNILQLVETTDEDILRDYMLWQLMEEYLVVTSTMKPADREEFCTEQAKKYFGEYIDHVVYGEYRLDTYEQELVELWQQIRSSFRKALETNSYPWMTEPVKTEALNKLNNMKLRINSYDHIDFPKYFQSLEIQSHNYVENIQNILLNRQIQVTNKLQAAAESLDTTQLFSFTPVYISSQNTIIIPVSLLQPFYFWHPVYPKTIKFATLGTLVE
ncbi:uncharacterized protein LOC133327811 [Musca vetustissima]|uniref:uncharacterized protein LOC133327811 n=1 Tax=Musca vetustissima TaxID=27455 RepID=UPI002AB60BD7|nr:uncharacterized protein LOC133327811 [Musca vetustissima]